MSALVSARLRIAALLLVAVLVETTIGPDLRVQSVAPDLMVLVAICAGFTGGAEQGAFVGFFAGLLTDLLVTDTPMGLSSLTYCLVGFGLGVLSSSGLPDTWFYRPLATAVATGTAVALFFGIGDLVGQSQLVISGPHWLLRVGIIEAVFNAILAVPAGRLYERCARHSKGADAVGAKRADRAATA